MILSDFRGPGAHFGGLGPIVKVSRIFCDFGDFSGRKGQSLLRSIFDHLDLLNLKTDAKFGFLIVFTPGKVVFNFFPRSKLQENL